MVDGPLPSGMRHPMRPLRIASSGMRAQSTRIGVIAENIANAETTRGLDGTPYRRKTVSLREAGTQPIAVRVGPDAPISFEQRLGGFEQQLGGVEVAAIQEDPSLGQFVYDPGHPDADDTGYVLMPNVSLTEEMVDMMDARRHFEANVTVFEAIKSILRRSAQL